jgi:hypothetical protein
MKRRWLAPVGVLVLAWPSFGRAAACADAKIDRLVEDLSSFSRRLGENEKRALGERRCDSPTVLCLNRLGELEHDALPDRLVSGRPFAVYAILPAGDAGNVTIATSSTAAPRREPIGPSPASTEAPASPDGECEPTGAQLDAIKTAAMPIARLASHPGLESWHVPAGSWNEGYWTRATPSIVGAWSDFAASNREAPSFVSVGGRFETPFGDIVDVEFQRTEREPHDRPIERHHQIPIDNGRYHLELGLLVPFVFNGARSAVLVPNPGTSDGRIAVQQDWHVTGAVALDFFPLGRSRSLGSSFRNCKSRSCLENWLGVQLGAGFGDFLREWYLGLVFEPVSGLNFDVGASLLKGEFLPPGRAEGMQLPQGTPIAAEAKYMLRSYFGFSITLDALQTLDRRNKPLGQLY